MVEVGGQLVVVVVVVVVVVLLLTIEVELRVHVVERAITVRVATPIWRASKSWATRFRCTRIIMDEVERGGQLVAVTRVVAVRVRVGGQLVAITTSVSVVVLRLTEEVELRVHVNDVEKVVTVIGGTVLEVLLRVQVV